MSNGRSRYKIYISGQNKNTYTVLGNFIINLLNPQHLGVELLNYYFDLKIVQEFCLI